MRINKVVNILLCILVGQMISSCYTTKPYYSRQEREWKDEQLPDDELIYTAYLIGDAGEAESDESSLSLLKEMVKEENPEQAAVIFLGDNLYPQGLHKKGHESREQDELYLNRQIDVVKDFKGRIVFIPGNHDWKEGKKEGWRFIKRQEDYIEDALGGKKTFLPDKGCPGPVVVKLGDEVRLIVIDTQWWLHKNKRPEGERFGCEVKNEIEFVDLLKDELRRNRNQHMLVVGHHPFFSNGNHGGEYTLKDHIFPLTPVRKNMYVPLPIIGSIYPLYRKVLGSHQDISFPRFQDMSKALVPAFEEYPGIVYAAGHEHNLQYIEKNDVHYVVSGSGCKNTYLKHGKPLNFGQSTTGFSRIRYYKNGEAWLEFFSGDKNEQGSYLIFRKKLEQADKSKADQDTRSTTDYSGQMETVIPFNTYKAGKFKRSFFGSLHRDTWTAPIAVPVLNINKVHGGLTPIKKGGGMQTKSLRFQGGDGHQYVIRTIQKDATSLVSKNMRQTVAQDVLLDGLAASHPYAAVVVPPIADAVKVYHTNPELVVVPDDATLGEYRNEFAGKLCLFEERPEGDHRSQASFGYSRSIIGSADLIDNLHHSYKHQVSDIAMLRARLLDIFLADWDRHDDQWRWASFDTKDGTVYKPIPRDRDQVFFYQDGLVPQLSNRKWAIRKFQSFKPDIRDMTGQNFNARYVDRAYLTELEKKDWILLADSMMSELSDDVLLSGLKKLPKAGYELEGEQLMQTLQLRRANLKKFAEEYYRILAKYVDVVGTEKDEFFEILRNEDGSTDVTVYPRKKGKPDRDRVIYHRKFHLNETKEINIYGLGGNDEYKVRGDVKKGTLVRIIGGLDKDKIDAKSKVAGLAKKTLIYDNKAKKGKSKIKVGDEAKVKLFKKSQSLEYEREEVKFNKTMPLLWLGFNPDDGIYLGAGFKYTRQGWKREPYKYQQSVKGNYAIRTGAFNFDYDWDYPELLGNWDFSGTIESKAPDYQFFYYGLGNETTRLENAENDYSLRLNEFNISPQLRRRVRDLHYFAIGPTLQFVTSTGDRSIIYDLVDSLPAPDDIDDRLFGGARMEYVLENKDNNTNPQRGIQFIARATYWNDLINGDVSFTKLESSLSLFLPINALPGKSTLALRAGAATNIGDSEFYQYNFVGGPTMIRGLRRNRFGGESSFYSTAELRTKLFQWFNYLLPLDFGVIAFSDQGRVWVDGDTSDKLHHALGAGLYISPLNAVVISGTYAVSDDDETINIQFGFSF
ncbi:MAG: BamA/TamA family outer membrane protein [Bacteroidia bacterium]|nr:BamA/TamA family outer membrane protein [Bacteroidia bacterium]